MLIKNSKKMLSKSQGGLAGEFKGLSAPGINILTMKSRSGLQKNTKKGTLVSSSGKRKNTGLNSN